MTKSKSPWPVAQTPIILRSHRLMEAFAKADDEREFYLDRVEGFIIYVNLNKAGEELDNFNKELKENRDRYVLVPKLTFFEMKKIMECFVTEKVYDVDTKEKLLDIIHSKEARENFLEFIYDHHSELEKWQQYYQERSRIRIIEWLRNNNFHFVFEEDLDVVKNTLEKLKQTLFQSRVPNDVNIARKTLTAKAKTYYSNEALNPRPKRGRPPKQQAKQEIEPQVTVDLYTQVPKAVHPFLFTPQISSAAAVTFSSKFNSEEDPLGSRRNQSLSGADAALESLNQKLASLRSLSASWLGDDTKKTPSEKKLKKRSSEATKKQSAKRKSESPVKTTENPAKAKAKNSPPKKVPIKKTPAKKTTSSTKKSKSSDSTAKPKLSRVRPLPGSKAKAAKKKAADKKSPTKEGGKTRLRPLKRTKSKKS